MALLRLLANAAYEEIASRDQRRVGELLIRGWREERRKISGHDGCGDPVGNQLLADRSSRASTYVRRQPDLIASLQWSFVDLKRGVIRLPESKTGEKSIYRSAPAIKLLKRWPRFAESPYVFPGNGRRQKGEHMHASTLTHTFQSIREAAELDDDLRLYDACRHSYASVAISDHGMSLAQIGEQLGHTQAQTTKRYAHLHETTGRQNADAIGGTIAAELKRRVR